MVGQAAPHQTIARVASFGLTAATLSVVQSKVAMPLLLLERFVPGLGWLEVLLVAAYAGWITGKLLSPRAHPRWRRRLWVGFSLVFFAQLALGVAGLDRMLMTGDLHLPVPALIAAGPIYRGEGFFMPILFATTVVLVGPAWCSHLCYIGAWDQEASRRKRRPTRLPAWARTTRIAILVTVLGVACGFRLLAVPGWAAAIAAGSFGVVGLVVMLAWSWRRGVMVHCTVYCPIGLAANLLGKLSPFRLRIGAQCDDCGRCEHACRFDALGPEHIARRRPALRCTLCGDCVRSCHSGAIHFRFPGVGRERARRAFIVLVASLHAVFLACARL